MEKKHNKEPSKSKTTKSKTEPTTPNKVGMPLLYNTVDEIQTS